MAKQKHRYLLAPLAWVLVVALVLVLAPRALASDCSISLYASDGSVGDTISLSVSASGDIAAATITVSYDTSLLEWTGGGRDNYGSVTFDDEYTSGGGDMSFSATFTALASGTASFSVVGYDVVDSGADNMNVSAGSTSSTISAASTASGNSLLSSLYVGSGYLDPEFSPYTTEYSLWVAESVDYLSISASPDDSSASVYVSGQSLDLGYNTVYVTCEAENGSSTTYYIYVYREGGEDDTSPSASPSPDPSSAVLPDGSTREIIDFDDEDLPKGFTRSTASYNGTTVDVGKHEPSGQLIVYLSGGWEYEDAFFLFDADTGLARPMTYQSPRGYLPIDLPREGLPDGYTASNAEIGNVTCQVLVPTGSAAGANHYIIYALNDLGDAGFYLYDPVEGTFQRYNFMTPVSPTPSPSPTATPSPTPTTTAEPTATPAPTATPEPVAPQPDPWYVTYGPYLVLGAIVLFALLLLWAILASIRLRKVREELDMRPDYVPGFRPSAETSSETETARADTPATVPDHELPGLVGIPEEPADADFPVPELPHETDEAPVAPQSEDFSFSLDDILKEYGDSPDDGKE